MFSSYLWQLCHIVFGALSSCCSVQAPAHTPFEIERPSLKPEPEEYQLLKPYLNVPVKYDGSVNEDCDLLTALGTNQV